MLEFLELHLKVPGELIASLARQLGANPLLAGIKSISSKSSAIYYDYADANLFEAGRFACESRVGRSRQRMLNEIRPARFGALRRTVWSTPLATGLGDSISGPGALADHFAILISATRLRRALPQHRAEADFGPVFSVDSQLLRWRFPFQGAELDLVFERGQVTAGDRVQTLLELRLVMAQSNDLACPEQQRLGLLFSALRQLQSGLPVFLSDRDALWHSAASVWEAPGETPNRSGADSDPVRARRIKLGQAQTPSAALGLIGENVLEQWRGNEDRVRNSAPMEHVHQLRVALRRLKTALKIFNDQVDPGWRDSVAPEIKWLGELLGAARDWDVFVEETLGPLVEADLGGGGNTGQNTAAAWGAVSKQAAERRADARQALQAALATPRYAALGLALMHGFADLAEPEITHANPDALLCNPVRDYAHARLKRYAKHLRAVDDLTALSEHDRHRERIRAKRLRYGLEFFASVLLDKPRRRALDAVGGIQEVLGAGNDAAVAQGLMDQLELNDSQRGFVRGWFAARKLSAARDAQRYLKALPKPGILAGK